MSPEKSLDHYRETVYDKLKVKEIELQGNELIPVFPLLRKATGLRLRDGDSMAYALSVVLDVQPQINLMGTYEDRICANQIKLLADGIVDSPRVWWLNLAPPSFSFRQTQTG